MTTDLTVENLRSRVNRALKSRFSNAKLDLEQAMSYACINEGKRMRPLLVYATGLALGATLEQLDVVACSVELIHTYSLIHDDLPAMDNDDLRRGQPACHKVFGEATAILAGNALQNFAFQLLAEDKTKTALVRLAMIQTLTHACGVDGILGGQALDLKAEQGHLSVERIEQIHQMKTGALIRASVKLGALAAYCEEVDTLKQLDCFAKDFGLAFQINDDILDASEKETDALNYLNTVGLDDASKRLTSLYEQAIQTLEVILTPDSCELMKAVSAYCLRFK